MHFLARSDESSGPRRATAKRELVLRAWETVSTERHLQGVLEAVADVLLPVVSFKGLGIVSFDGVNHGLYAMHVVGCPHEEGETLEQFFMRTKPPAQTDIPTRPFVEYPAESLERARNGVVSVCNDLLGKTEWYDHEF